MAGNEVENMMTSFPVFRCVCFFGRSSPYPNIYVFPYLKRKFKTVLNDKSVTAGIGTCKGDNSKTTKYNPINLHF